jgi:hypothetical protein
MSTHPESRLEHGPDILDHFGDDGSGPLSGWKDGPDLLDTWAEHVPTGRRALEMQEAQERAQRERERRVRRTRAVQAERAPVRARQTGMFDQTLALPYVGEVPLWQVALGVFVLVLLVLAATKDGGDGSGDGSGDDVQTMNVVPSTPGGPPFDHREFMSVCLADERVASDSRDRMKWCNRLYRKVRGGR